MLLHNGNVHSFPKITLRTREKKIDNMSVVEINHIYHPETNGYQFEKIDVGMVDLIYS